MGDTKTARVLCKNGCSCTGHKRAGGLCWGCWDKLEGMRKLKVHVRLPNIPPPHWFRRVIYFAPPLARPVTGRWGNQFTKAFGGAIWDNIVRAYEDCA